jgi:tetratricopeptide (TPR) repeat protein
VNVHDGYPMWGDKVDESASEMFALEDSISAKVAKALTLELSRAEWAGLNRQYTRDPEAYAAYLKGRYFVTQQTAAARVKSIDAFQEAVARDPMYALGYAELAHAYSAQGVYQDVVPKDAWPKSEAAAMKALELDPTLSEAHGALGSVRLNWDRNWPAAAREFLRALQLDPQNALAQRNYAWLLQSQGRFSEALPARLRAIEVDPLSPAARREAAWTYYLAGRDDESIAQYKAALELDPNFVQAHIGLAKIYARRNQHDQAIESARTAAKIDPTPGALGWLGYAYARAGKRAEARAILDQLLEQSRSRHVGWQHVAVIYIGLGDADNAFKWLDKGVIDGSNIAFLKLEPAVEPLRSDARYKPLIRRAGFEP